MHGILNYFTPMLHFYTPWKSYKTKGFLTFLGGIEMEHFRPRILVVEYKKQFKKQGLDIYLAFEQLKYNGTLVVVMTYLRLWLLNDACYWS